MRTQRKELNFKGQNIYIGIDVHKKSWTVCIFSEHLEHRQFVQPASVEALSGYLHRTFPGATCYSVYEAGFCGFHVHEKLEAAGIHNIVVNAADVPTTHKEKANKTDKRDSRKLARSLRANELTAIHIPTGKTQEDRALVRMRYTVRKDLSRIKCRIKSLLNFYGKEHPVRFSSPGTHWSGKYMEWLKTIPMQHESGHATLQILIGEAEAIRKILLIVTQKIRALSRTESYVKNFELIDSVPGIGLVTGMFFLTAIEDINRFPSTDRFAGYVGLVPSCHDTGENEKHGPVTSRAPKMLRDMIIESAWTAARKDPALHLAFCQLCKRMDSNKAIIRIARKLLNRIYCVLKIKIPYVYGLAQ